MKTCTRCQLEKIDEDFPLSYSKKRPETRKSWCRKCENRRNSEKRKRKDYKGKTIQHFGGKCMNPHCLLKGIDLPNIAYDIHHVGDKDYEISRLLDGRRSWTKIKKELEKCVLLCAICHRQEHA